MAQLLSRIVSNVSGCWKPLVAADLVFKVLAFVLLTPLLGGLIRVLLAVAGAPVLADQDILYFMLGPVGWICAALAGGIWLAIAALGQAALLGILAAERLSGNLSAAQALSFAGKQAVPLLKVTVRMVAYTLLSIAPFLAVIGLIYTLMLGEHDINFYLKEKPPEFLAAVAMAALAVALLVGVLLRLFSGWFLALPVVLFEQVTPSSTLQASKARIKGSRGLVLVEIVLWFVGTSLLSTLIRGTAVAIGRVVVPMAVESLTLLLLVIGALVLLWIVFELIINLLSTILFASMLFTTYEHMGGEARLDALLDDTEEPQVAWFNLTTPRLAAISLTAVVLSAVLGALLIRTLRVDDDVVVIAHRGAATRAPENTLASLQLAIEEGTDWVEIDVQETADGDVAVFHDSDFMRLAGNPLKIWDATAADLEAIDIGSSFSPEFRDERTPLLGEVLELCKGKVQVLIELKYYGHDKQLEQRVLDLVAKHGMESQVMYMSLNLPGINKLKTLEPQAKAGILLSVAAGDLKSVSTQFWAMNARFADRGTIKEAHDSDRLVYVWTVNDPLTMSRMIGKGVDGLITDDAALARAVIRQRSQLSPAERLLLELADLFGLEHQVFEQ